MAKDLELKVQLPISDANQGLLALIAMSSGWTPETQIAPEEFIAKEMLTSHIEGYFKDSVSRAHAWYFGQAGEKSREEVLQQLETELIISVDIKERK